MGLVLLILFSNIKGILFNCFHAYDFGIYQQGIINLAAGESLNPFLTVRGVSTFNDHFMPVLFLAVPFVWLFNFNPTSLIFFEWLWFIFFLYLVWKNFNEKKKSLVLFSLALALFSKGILTGLEFPIHPGTWSMPIWFLLIKNIKNHNEKNIFIFSFILSLFREAYPFGVLLLGFYYLFQRRWRLGSALSLFSTLYLYFVLILRKSLLGPTADYGSKLLKGLVSSPVEFLLEVLRNFEFLVVFKLFIPFIFLLALILYFEIKNEAKLNRNKWVIASFLLILPLFGIHFLTNQYHFHYGPAFVAPLLSIAFLTGGYEKIFSSKRLSTLLLLVFIATSSGRYTKFFNNLFLSKNNKCTFEHDYYSETLRVKEFFEKNYKGKVILASGGVIQSIMQPGIEIYPPDTMVALPPYFDLIVFLRNGSGDTYPWNKHQVEEAISRCSAYVDKEILSSKFYYLASGKFPAGCLSVYP
ncbi:MAG: hypothetical protein ACJAT2_000982 [Bacteriovoracaceae bacterium]|jgi:hypothetical protein